MPTRNTFRPHRLRIEFCGTCVHFRFSRMSHDMSSGSVGYCTRRASRQPDLEIKETGLYETKPFPCGNGVMNIHSSKTALDQIHGATLGNSGCGCNLWTGSTRDNISRTRNENAPPKLEFEARSLPRTSRGRPEEVNCGAYAKLGYHLNLGLGFVISDCHDPGYLGTALTDSVSYGC